MRAFLSSFFICLLINLTFVQINLVSANDANNNKDKNDICNIKIAFEYEVNQLTVDFSNISLGNYDDIEWNFGDDNKSKQVKAKHTYQEEGKYTFCLKAINSMSKCEEEFCGELYVFE
ncbi:MAG: PKD domain-containing protein [Chitinophagales bacterium]